MVSFVGKRNLVCCFAGNDTSSIVKSIDTNTNVTIPEPSTTTTTTPTKISESTTKATTKPTEVTTPTTVATTTTPPTTNATTAAPLPTKPTVQPETTPNIPLSTPATHKDRHFDGPSFIGGIVLAMGLMAIAFVSFKFYKARTERNYHTL